MASLEELETRRESILEQLRSIRSLRRGTISEQYLKGRAAGGGEPVRRGPYYVLSRHEKGGTVSRRLKSAKELEEARRDVAAHRRFRTLCRELEEVTEKLGELEREGAEPEGKKKRRGSPSSGIGRWDGFWIACAPPGGWIRSRGRAPCARRFWRRGHAVGCHGVLCGDCRVVVT